MVGDTMLYAVHVQYPGNGWVTTERIVFVPAKDPQEARNQASRWLGLSLGLSDIACSILRVWVVAESEASS